MNIYITFVLAYMCIIFKKILYWYIEKLKIVIVAS